MVVNEVLGFSAWWCVEIFYTVTPGFIVGQTHSPHPCGLPSNFRAIYCPVNLCHVLSGSVFDLAKSLWLRGYFLFSSVLDAFKNESKISSFQHLFENRNMICSWWLVNSVISQNMNCSNIRPHQASGRVLASVDQCSCSSGSFSSY